MSPLLFDTELTSCTTVKSANLESSKKVVESGISIDGSLIDREYFHSSFQIISSYFPYAALKKKLYNVTKICSNFIDCVSES